MTRRPAPDHPSIVIWKNTAPAVAKASLTATRHTCGRHAVDVTNSRLLIDDSFAMTDSPFSDLNDDSPASDLLDADSLAGARITFNEAEPVRCWSEQLVDVCIAPVLVCKTVVQTVGGGDNVSAAGLVLQI